MAQQENGWVLEQQPDPESRSAGWIYLFQIRVYIILHIQPDHLIPLADLPDIFRQFCAGTRIFSHMFTPL